MLKQLWSGFSEFCALRNRMCRQSLRPVEPGRVLGRSEHGWLLVAGRQGSGVERVPVSPRPEGRGLEVMN